MYLELEDKTKLFYRMDGNPNASENVLFVSGWTSDSNFWIPFLPFFAQQRCIRVDNRGVGKTEIDPTQEFSIKDLAHDLLALIRHLKLDKVYLFGISMGGMISQQLALEHAEVVQRLVLLSTSAWIPAQGRFLFERLVNLEPLQPDLFVDILLGHCYGQNVWENPRLLAAFQATCAYKKAHPQAPGYCAKQFYALITHDTQDQLSHLTVPTMVIAGEEDTLIPPRFGRQLHQLILGSRFLELAREGHVPTDLSFLSQVKQFFGFSAH